MKTVNASSAHTNLETLIDFTLDENLPIRISAETGSAVLLSESHWNGIWETLHLLSIPSMRESISQGMAEPVAYCFSSVDL